MIGCPAEGPLATLHVFNVKGVHPATGELMEMLLVADDAQAAKRHAESIGLRLVTVSHDKDIEDGRGTNGASHRDSN